MLITDQQALRAFATPKRLWQGIPGIEVTERGRTFETFYSGGTAEGRGNYCVLVYSDNGTDFSEPIAVAFEEGEARCYDPCLWIDPLGRLWFWWGQSPNNAVHAVICDEPDAETLVWGQEFVIGQEVMMNKPIVCATGEWLFPIAVWSERMVIRGWNPENHPDARLAFVYRSVDRGKSFQRLGGVDVPERSFDEHMLLEKADGTLDMLVRTEYGIGMAHSWDGGLHWSAGHSSELGGPCSRFHIRRLSSGKILLVNHVGYSGRNNLHALLSDDDGKTWKWKLLLDARDQVSYPDATERDGFLYITYDRERGSFKNSISEAYASAREILMAKITEADIMAGRLVNPDSRLQVIVSKLGVYADEASNPYREVSYYSAEEVARTLSATDSRETILQKIFECYPMNCMNLHRVDSKTLDALIVKLERGAEKQEKTVAAILTLLRAASSEKREVSPVIAAVCQYARAHIGEEIGVGEIADRMGISLYYLSHLFKKETGSTLTEYLNELKIARAKTMLSQSDEAIGRIALACGFSDASYFAKRFLEVVGLTPGEYRRLHGVR